MTGSLTAEIQADARPELDELYDAVGQQVTLYAEQPAVSVPGAAPPDEYDRDGNLISAPPVDVTPDTPGYGQPLGTFGCVFWQMDVTERATRPALGADLAVPVWEGYVHHSAPLATPGVLLVVAGGELPAPLLLQPITDAEDLGTQRVAWHIVARAPEATRSA